MDRLSRFRRHHKKNAAALAAAAGATTPPATATATATATKAVATTATTATTMTRPATAVPSSNSSSTKPLTAGATTDSPRAPPPVATAVDDIVVHSSVPAPRMGLLTPPTSSLFRMHRHPNQNPNQNQNHVRHHHNLFRTSSPSQAQPQAQAQAQPPPPPQPQAQAQAQAQAPPLPSSASQNSQLSQASQTSQKTSETTTAQTTQTGSSSSRDAAVANTDHSSRVSRSPFRGLLQRPSAKRSRASPPATTAASAAVAAASANGVPTPNNNKTARSQVPARSSQLQHVSTPGSRTSSKNSSRANSAAGMATITTAGSASAKGDLQSLSASQPQMPPFLKQSDNDITSNFYNIEILERARLQSSFISPTGRWARPRGAQLKPLNRYLNIQPWDRNRVRLKVPPGHVDYINASPIVLTTTAPEHAARPPDRYIAMQGPKEASVDHVWRMVYEQLRSPAVIVMLTETHEANLEKCYPYFPRHPDEAPMLINAHDEFGDGFRASVRCDAIEETPFGDAIELRRILLRVHRKARSSTSATKTGLAPGLAAGVGVPPKAAAASGANSTAASETASVQGAASTTAAVDSDEEPNYDSEDNAEAEAAEDHVMEDAEPAAEVDKNKDVASVAGAAAPAPVPVPVPVPVPPPEPASTPAPASAPASAPTSAPTSTPASTSAPASASPSGSSSVADFADEDYEDERVVYHFLYKRWPDFGVPDLEDLDSFLGLMRLSDEKNADADNPRIVHCSAGVGRSGTFIALEHLMRELDAGLLNYGEPQSDETTGQQRGRQTMRDDSESPDPDEDLIFTTVNQLREQRKTMVQAEAQYHFIYHVLRKLWKEKYGIASRSNSQHSHTTIETSSADSNAEDEGAERAAKRHEVDVS